MNTKYYSLKEYKKSPKNCIVVLTIRFLTNDAEILLWKYKWIEKNILLF